MSLDRAAWGQTKSLEPGRSNYTLAVPFTQLLAAMYAICDSASALAGFAPTRNITSRSLVVIHSKSSANVHY